MSFGEERRVEHRGGGGAGTDLLSYRETRDKEEDKKRSLHPVAPLPESCFASPGPCALSALSSPIRPLV